MVTLSACETEVGVQDYSEGIFGLIRAFRIAGARSVLMTLKKVDDQQAKNFMIHFYDHWLNNPKHKTPSQALQATQLEYIHHKDPKLRDPEVWSPYVLVE